MIAGRSLEATPQASGRVVVLLVGICGDAAPT
jgi:hypothetical protein